MKRYIYQVFMVHGRDDYQTDVDFGYFTNLPMAKEFIKMATLGGKDQLTVKDFDVYRHTLNLRFRADAQPQPTLVKVNWE